MTTKSIQCREHGGMFTVESRRGRPPVRCTSDNSCSMAPRTESKRRVAEALAEPKVQEFLGNRTLTEWRKAAKEAGFSRATILKLNTPRQFRELLGEDNVRREQAGLESIPTPVKRTRKPAVPVAEVEMRVNLSVPSAHAAKALLEPQGWTVKGSASFEGGYGMAHLTATRGEELLTMVWENGRVVSQDYSIWSTEVPKENNTPKHKLPFDPDEMTDSEMVRAMSGMKVTWWNRIAQSTEIAIVSKDSVRVMHNYSGAGDETPADRVVTFVSMDGSGFRSFRLGALLKIG